jgi:hypothetical protein
MQGDSQTAFARAIAEIAKAIAIDIYRREPVDVAFYSSVAKEAYDDMFNSMNGTVDLPINCVEAGIHAEVERQKHFFEDIERISIPFGKACISFKVESLSTIHRDSFWDTGAGPQCTVRIGERNFILAFAPGPGMARIAEDDKTSGMAAAIIYASPHSILLLPGGEIIGGAAGQAIQVNLGEFRRFNFPFTKSAFTGPGFVNVDVDQPLSGKEMDVLLKDASVNVVVINNFYTGLTTLHVRGEKELSMGMGSLRLQYWTFQALQKHS